MKPELSPVTRMLAEDYRDDHMVSGNSIEWYLSLTAAKRKQMGKIIKLLRVTGISRIQAIEKVYYLVAR